MHSTYKVDLASEHDHSAVPAATDTFNTGSAPKQRSYSMSAAPSNGSASMKKAESRPKSFTLKSAATLATVSGAMSKGSRKHAPAPPQKSSLGTCIACYDYAPRQSDELSIKEGDLINLHEKCDADWWKGEVNGRVGMFPASYVEQTS